MNARFITNPPVVLKEPFNFNRENPEEYVSSLFVLKEMRPVSDQNHQSLIEQKTLQELGVFALPDWKITGARTRFTPRTRAGKNARILEELERMKAHADETGGVVDSMHINGIVKYSGDLP